MLRLGRKELREGSGIRNSPWRACRTSGPPPPRAGQHAPGPTPPVSRAPTPAHNTRDGERTGAISAGSPTLTRQAARGSPPLSAVASVLRRGELSAALPAPADHRGLPGTREREAHRSSYDRCGHLQRRRWRRTTKRRCRAFSARNAPRTEPLGTGAGTPISIRSSCHTRRLRREDVLDVHLRGFWRSRAAIVWGNGPIPEAPSDGRRGNTGHLP